MPVEPQGHERPEDVNVNAVHIAKVVVGEDQDEEMKQPAERKRSLAWLNVRMHNTAKGQSQAITLKGAVARKG